MKTTKVRKAKLNLNLLEKGFSCHYLGSGTDSGEKEERKWFTLGKGRDTCTLNVRYCHKKQEIQCYWSFKKKKIFEDRLGHRVSLDLFICFTSQWSRGINLPSLLCLVSLIGMLRIGGWASLVRTARIQALTLTTLVTMTAISRLTINQSAVKAQSWDNDGREHSLTGSV